MGALRQGTLQRHGQAGAGPEEEEQRGDGNKEREFLALVKRAGTLRIASR